MAVFFVHGLLFASWTSHIPHVKEHLHLGDGSLGIALLGAPVGSIVAMLLATQLLPRFGSRRVVRVALFGYCLAGPLVGLSDSFSTFFVAFLIWGAFQGTLDVSMNTQAISVERRASRMLMSGFHGSWSVGSLVGAGVGILGVGIGWSLSEQLLLLAAPCLLIVGWLTTRMIPDQEIHIARSSRSAVRGRRSALQADVLVLGVIALIDMLCEGAAADWAAVYLRGSLHTSTVFASLGYTAYLLMMVVVRLLGNRLMTQFPVRYLLPFLAAVATVGFAIGLAIDRPASVLVGLACLGAGLAPVIPTIFSA